MPDHLPFFRRHLAARLTREGAYGLHMTVGLACMLVATCLFGMLAAAVLTDPAVVLFDTQVANWFHQHAASPWTPFMLFITNWHKQPGILAMAALLAFILYRRGAHYWIATVLLAVPGGMLLNVLLKYSFQRARPVFDDPLVTLSTYSFPSGHAAGATVFYGVLAAYLVCASTRWSERAAAVLAAVCMVALVALSRVYLGAHYLSDVLAAMAVGCAWLAVCITAMSTLRRSRTVRPTD